MTSDEGLRRMLDRYVPPPSPAVRWDDVLGRAGATRGVTKRQQRS